MPNPPKKPLIVEGTNHGTCVALNNRAALLIGKSGAGKSALALQMMALGCGLVCDDTVSLAVSGKDIIASAPATARPLIEARGIGLLNANLAPPTPLVVIVNLDAPADKTTDRLPPRTTIQLGAARVDIISQSLNNPNLPAALLQYLKAGRGA